MIEEVEEVAEEEEAVDSVMEKEEEEVSVEIEAAEVVEAEVEVVTPEKAVKKVELLQNNKSKHQQNEIFILQHACSNVVIFSIKY